MHATKHSDEYPRYHLNSRVPVAVVPCDESLIDALLGVQASLAHSLRLLPTPIALLLVVDQLTLLHWASSIPVDLMSFSGFNIPRDQPSWSYGTHWIVLKVDDSPPYLSGFSSSKSGFQVQRSQQHFFAQKQHYRLLILVERQCNILQLVMQSGCVQTMSNFMEKECRCI